MADGGGFQVIFKGELVGDRPEGTVRQQLAGLFKMPESKVGALFSGKPVVVKRGLDEATARRFEAAFRKAGAVCELRGPSAERTAASGSKPADQGRATADAAASGALSGSLAAAGDPHNTVLDVKPPASLEGLEMADSDAPLASTESAAAAEIDTAGLELAQTGGNLTEPSKAPEADIDTSDLSLEDPNG